MRVSLVEMVKAFEVTELTLADGTWIAKFYSTAEYESEGHGSTPLAAMIQMDRERHARLAKATAGCVL